MITVFKISPNTQKKSNIDVSFDFNFFLVLLKHSGMPNWDLWKSTIDTSKGVSMDTFIKTMKEAYKLIQQNAKDPHLLILHYSFMDESCNLIAASCIAPDPVNNVINSGIDPKFLEEAIKSVKDRTLQSVKFPPKK